MDSRSVVASFFTCWRVQDVEWAIAHYHENAVYELHVDPSAALVDRVYRGREACRAALYALLKDFDYLKYEPVINSVSGATVRARVAFRYRHRTTGEILEGSRRLVFQVREGLIVRVDGYYDTKLFSAFVRLMKDRERSMQLRRPPQPPRRQREGSGA